MFYAIKDNKIFSFGNSAKEANMGAKICCIKDDTLLETDEEIVRDDNGILRLKSEWEREQKTDEYKAKQAEKERERIAMLSLTAADVERAIYKAKGLDFDDIIAFVEQSNAQIDIKALKIELKANNFYRGNPYIEQVGTLLGMTTEQLDELFETNDYKALLSAEKQTSS